MVKENKKTVCVFDSGIGGLNVLAACVKSRKDCDFAYFADNYNMPYGNLPHGKIIELTDEKFSLIERLQPAAAVIACNTVTAECVGYLRSKYSFPIIGMQPAVKPAAKTGGKCVVLSTIATANSPSLKKLVAEYGGGNTQVAACPELAGYIEENIFKIDKNAVIKLLPDVECDTIVLGCTHYNYVYDIISEHYKCPIFDGTEGMVRRLNEILGICDHRNEKAEIVFYGGDYMKNVKIYNYLISKNAS